MIYSLTGKILKKTLDTVVISCAGVGYAVQVPLTTAESLPAPGREGTVYTVMNVTENDVSLYGFATEEQRSCFKMLTSVSGVGPKAGLAILSIMTPERVALGGVQRGPQGVYQGERRWPQAGPAYCSGTERQSGQGPGRMGTGFGGGAAAAAPAPSSAPAQAVAALVALGYNTSDAAAAVARIDETLPVQDIIKIALRGLSRA